MRPARRSSFRLIVLGILPIAAALLALGAAAPAAGSRSGLETPFVEPSNCGDCENCLEGHRAPPNVNGTIGSLHSWCMTTSNCTHPGCGVALTTPPSPDFQALDDLVQLALAGDNTAIRQIVLLYPDKASYNVGRQALQVEGCNTETIVAHIPLTAEALAVVQQYSPMGMGYASR